MKDTKGLLPIAYSLLAVLELATASAIEAQIVPDATLPNPSLSTLDGNTFAIEGGTAVGGNLFHSFQDFSLPTGSEAFFNNAANVNNIITRVTGGRVSNIDGLIRANGTANLFLLNPSGIVFGPNANLDLGGSFFASTANRLLFDDGVAFSANPQETPLLTINVPIGLQLGANSGDIIVRSQAIDRANQTVGLQVLPGQTLGLVGGNLSIEGGNLTAAGGRIELGAIRNGEWQLGSDPPSIDLNWQLGNILLDRQASVNASGEGGGSIQVVADHLRLTQNSGIFADTLGAVDGRGIAVDVNRLQIDAGAYIAAATFASGKGGNLNIHATESVDLIGISFAEFQRLYVLGAFDRSLSASTRSSGLFGGTQGTGQAGTLTVDTGKLTLQNGGVIATNAYGEGNSNNIIIRASDLVRISQGAIASSSIQGNGDAGDITVETGRLEIIEGGFFSTSTIASGDGATISLRASDSILVDGFPADALFASSIASITFAGATGKGGDIVIDTRELRVANGAGIGASSGTSTFRDQLSAIGGPAGSITVNASNLVEVSGTSPDGLFRSRIINESFNASTGGDIRINTPQLRVLGGGQISTATFNQGLGGSVIVNAETIDLAGTSANGLFRSGLFASVGNEEFLDVTGIGGSLSIDTNELTVRQGGTLTVQSFGAGEAGALNVAANTIVLDEGATANATTASGEGGEIALVLRDYLLLRNDSQITAQARGSGNGGNININSPSIVVLESQNSDIIANAFGGNGGNINIEAEGIIGIVQTSGPLNNSLSEINASSEAGIQGSVNITSPYIDTSSGLVELGSETTDPSDLVVSTCGAAEGSSFTITGRGGLPENPIETLNSQLLWEDLRNLIDYPPETTEAIEIPPLVAPEPRRELVEATGWIVREDGTVELVAEGGESGSRWGKIPPCQPL